MPFNSVDQELLIENLAGITKHYLQNPESLAQHCVNHSGDIDVFKHLTAIFRYVGDVQNELQVLYGSTCQLDTRFSATVSSCLLKTVDVNHDRFFTNMLAMIVGQSDVAHEFAIDAKKFLEIFLTEHTSECDVNDRKQALSADIFSEGLLGFLQGLNKTIGKYHDAAVTVENLQNLTTDLDKLARKFGVTTI